MHIKLPYLALYLFSIAVLPTSDLCYVNNVRGRNNILKLSDRCSRGVSRLSSAVIVYALVLLLFVQWPYW